VNIKIKKDEKDKREKVEKDGEEERE